MKPSCTRCEGREDSVVRSQSESCMLNSSLPCPLSGEPFVEQSQDLGNVELYVFKVEILLSVLLHLEKIVQLEIQLEKTPITSFASH